MKKVKSGQKSQTKVGITFFESKMQQDMWH